MQTITPGVPGDHPNDPSVAGTLPSAAGPEVRSASRTAGWRKIVKGFVLVLILLSLAGFCSHILGLPMPGLAGPAKNEKTDKEEKDPPPTLGVALVKGRPHTVDVPENVRAVLGIRKGQQDLLVVAQQPTTMRPLVLSGSTALDPIRLARIRARFAPARVVEISRRHDFSHKTGRSEFRELRSGDRVAKREVLGIFYSVDVGSKKNDLLDALTQLQLDQKVLDNAEKHREAVPDVFMITAERAVQTDRNQVDRALHNLEAWDIPQDEIDALREEAKKQAADQNAWKKTREGTWVTGGKVSGPDKIDPDKNAENPWGRVTLRAPFDGIIVERNVSVDEMVVDQTVNLFQIADVNRLLVIANAPEDQLPILEALHEGERRWTVRTVGAETAEGLPGTIDEIGYLIDPNQHTAIIKGYVDNPGQRLRAGQYVAATVPIPPPAGVVEIPVDALVDDGQQSLVFVQTDATKPQYTMRRVQVTHRFDQKVFVRSTPIPKEEQLTAREAEEGLLPKEALQPGDRVLQSGAGELKAALLDLESQPDEGPQDATR